MTTEKTNPRSLDEPTISYWLGVVVQYEATKKPVSRLPNSAELSSLIESGYVFVDSAGTRCTIGVVPTIEGRTLLLYTKAIARTKPNRGKRKPRAANQ